MVFNFARFCGQIQTRVFSGWDNGKPKCPKCPKKGGVTRSAGNSNPLIQMAGRWPEFHDQEEKWPKEGREQHPFNYSMVRKGAEKKRTTGWSGSRRGKNALNLSILNPIYVNTSCFEDLKLNMCLLDPCFGSVWKVSIHTSLLPWTIVIKQMSFFLSHVRSWDGRCWFW